MEAQLLRIPDKQICCIYSSKVFKHYRLDSHIKVRALDTPDGFLRGHHVQPGNWKAGFINMDASEEMQCSPELPLRFSSVSFEISKRFHYSFHTGAKVEFGVTPEGYVAIIGAVLEAKKFSIEHCGVYPFLEYEDDNNGVTIAHILSELECNNE